MKLEGRRLLALAEEAARRGGDVILRHWREGTSIRNKASHNLVSDADLEAEQVILETLRRGDPQAAMIAEESQAEHVDDENVWIVDPLDGTNNFAHRVPQFSVSVARYRGGKPICGVVLDPLRGQCFTAVAGEGAFCDGVSARVGNEETLAESLIGVGFYYDRGAIMENTLFAIRDLFHQRIHGIRRFGSAALDLCYVGTGLFGAFFEFELSTWDFAAGRLFVEEAGGKVTTCHGAPLPLRKTSVLASNGRLHAAMLKTLAPYTPGD